MSNDILEFYFVEKPQYMYVSDVKCIYFLDYN